MRSLHYVLDEQGNATPLPGGYDSLLEWSHWFENAANRVVKQDTFTIADKSILVSTVFLGTDHGFDEDKPSVLWETMILGDQDIIDQLVDLADTETRSIIALFFGGKDIQKRYTSRETAEKGHKQMVEFVTVCLPRIKIGEASNGH